MTHSVRLAAGLAFILSAAATSDTIAQAPRDSQGSPTVTFQVEVDYVDVDVVVTDEQGNFVRGLTRDDFEVLEDGKPVKIDTFSTVEIPIERFDTARFGGKTPVADVRTNRTVLGGRFYVIVLDDVGTSPLRSQYVIKAAREFVEKHFAANDTAAVVYTSGNRQRSQEFTSDRTLLLASIGKFQGTKLRSSTLDKLDGYYQDLALAEQLSAQKGEPVDPGSDEVRNASGFGRGQGYPNRTYDLNDMERGHRALGVLGQLKSYAEFLANVRGRRKAMLLFSEGIDYPVHDIFGAQEATSVLRALEDAIAAAARANVNIFTVDPRGLVGLTSEYIELNRSNAELYNIGSRDPRALMQPQTALLAEMRQTQDSLRTLAEQTGGLASIDTNTFASAFDRIVQANSLYYMIGYYPPNHPRDGRFHRIEVRTKRPGLRVLARRGYASPRARDLTNRERQRVERDRIARTKGSDQTSSELRAMLDSPIQQSGIGLDVQAAPFKGAARNASVALAIEIDASRVQFAPPANNGVFSNTVELSLYGINQQGKPLQGMRTALDLTLRPDTHTRVKQYGLRANPRIELPPGRYQLRIGVRESGAGEMGTVFHDVDVPDFTREPLSMSGLLVTAPSAQRVMTVQPDETVGKVLPGAPTTRRTFTTSDALALYAEIYAQAGQIAQRVDVTTRLISEAGREISVSRDELTGATAPREKFASYSFSKTLPLRDVAPGAYLLRVEAQRRGDPDRVVARETAIRVVAE
ncbi:MAG TPA: VWA domain-containing protein [Vicinamibacterales bacterium]|nr:VWA domain-containing protein [Vicinamibacterales bacterium]